MATADQITELVDKMTQERARLVDEVSGLSDEEATRMPVGKTGEEQWTAKEQLAHLCEMELSYDAWVRAALESDNPDIGKMPWQRAAIPVEDANEHAVRELLQVMAQEREDTLRLIRGMDLDQFERTATHPNFGTLTALQYLRSFYRHDRMHADQIAGREPEYRPRYSGAEPDQRTPRLKARQAQQ